MSRADNCLSKWFPKLQAAGLPVPRTHIVQAPPGILDVLDGKTPDGWEQFIADLSMAALRVCYPCFLRTGLTSGKHRFKDCPLIQKPGDFPQHVYNLVEHSQCVDFLGLPCDVFAVREMLPTIPVGHCPLYGDMPVCREFRFFVQDGEIRCQHPYWPRASLEEGFPILSGDPFDDEPVIRDLPPNFYEMYKDLCCVSVFDVPGLLDLARAAGRALGGHWSIDILETRKGWFVIDCARAEDSFHWPDCPNAKEKA